MRLREPVTDECTDVQDSSCVGFQPCESAVCKQVAQSSGEEETLVLIPLASAAEFCELRHELSSR